MYVLQRGCLTKEYRVLLAYSTPLRHCKESKYNYIPNCLVLITTFFLIQVNIIRPCGGLIRLSGGYKIVIFITLKLDFTFVAN